MRLTRIAALLPAGVFALSAAFVSAAPAQADEPENPLVVCEDANNEIDVNFQGGTAGTETSIWHGCVSAQFPSIVYGEVQPRPGTVTGTPSAATVNIPQWKVVYYDANDDEVAETVLNVTVTYLGPLPQVMVGTMLATDPSLQVTAGTASRACRTGDLCTYYNTALAIAAPAVAAPA
ncbi:hypothetical protein [Streptomyces sp. NPDC002640]